MSDGFIVEVHYRKNGVDGTEVWRNKQVHAACWLTRKKHGKDKTVITGTTTRMMTHQDKKIPAPPPGWKFQGFKTNMKKNRFGRLVAGRAEETMEFEE